MRSGFLVTGSTGAEGGIGLKATGGINAPIGPEEVQRPRSDDTYPCKVASHALGRNVCYKGLEVGGVVRQGRTDRCLPCRRSGNAPCSPLMLCLDVRVDRLVGNL